MTTIKVQRETLVKAVDKVSAAVITALRFAIIGQKKVEGRGTLASLEAYDGKNMELQTHFYVNTECETTKFVNVNGKEFSSVVKALGKLDGDFTINFLGESDAATELSISVGEADAAIIKIPVLDDCLLMERPSEKPFCSIKVITENLLKAINQGAYAYGIKGVAGVYFNVTSEGTEIFSLDGRRGAKSFLKGEVQSTKENITDCSFYVGPSISNIKGILTMENTNIFVLDNIVLVQSGTDVAIINRISDKFPISSIKQIYETRQIEACLEMGQKEFLNALDIVSVPNDAKTKPIILKMEDNKLFLLSSKGNAKLQVKATVKGNFDMFAFGVDLLRKAVENSGEHVLLKYVSPQQPLWIESKDNESSYAFICPVNPASL